MVARAAVVPEWVATRLLVAALAERALPAEPAVRPLVVVAAVAAAWRAVAQSPPRMPSSRLC